MLAEKQKSVTLIIQARCNSARLPGKVLLPLIDNIPSILMMYSRVQTCKYINDIIIATTTNSEDDPLYQLCIREKIKCYRGSEDNVLERYYQTARLANSSIIMRCTGDCPLIDPEACDKFIQYFLNPQNQVSNNPKVRIECNNLTGDYNNKSTQDTTKYFIDGNPHYQGMKYIGSFPSGFDMEIFTFSALKTAFENATNTYDLEHVTPYIKHNLCPENPVLYSLTVPNITLPFDLSKLHLSLDTMSDYHIIKRIFKELYHQKTLFTYKDVLNLLIAHPEIVNNYIQDQSDLYSQNKLMLDRAEKIMMQPPLNETPLYFNKFRGTEISTIDGKKIKNFLQTDAILGSGDVFVNSYVHQAINAGHLNILQSAENVKLLELLISLHPWAQKGLLSASVENLIRFFILSKNRVLLPISYQNMFSGDNFYFYTDLDHLFNLNTENIMNSVVLVQINSLENNYLKKLQSFQSFCRIHSIYLILDESKTAFRLNGQGLHMKIGFEPDIAIFGPSMGNGYDIAAIIFKNAEPLASQNFIIKPHKIAVSASLATLKKIHEYKIWEKIIELSNYFSLNLKKDKWKTSGLPCSPNIFNITDNGAVDKLDGNTRDYFLKMGILTDGCIEFTYSHTKIDIDAYLKAMSVVSDKTF